MKDIKYTLIADGSSDMILLNIIKWSLDNLYPRLPNEGSFADFRQMKNPPRRLTDKVREAKLYYPFDILFVHRDAESTNPRIIHKRIREVSKELSVDDVRKTICIIPVKMMETWLLIDENAIKKAAGNRNYRGNFILPSLRSLERESQPKELLHSLLREASGKKDRNLKKFNIDKAVHLVAENIEDYSPLRNLVAFRAFEEELKKVVDKYLED
ncbi:MAG: hypothetical protein RBS73_13815 [Prolixibacteraceae bacterium]|jgi:hypothetical protein|nr:hypothetical protein [Prolixibacteraceae bacterium]